MFELFLFGLFCFLIAIVAGLLTQWLIGIFD